MSLDLTVANSISSGTQVVQDQNGASSALSLATNQVVVKGQDVVGGALPLVVQGTPVGTGQQTWGRIIRLVGFGGSANFFDIGIDQSGNLFLNGPNSTATVISSPFHLPEPSPFRSSNADVVNRWRTASASSQC